LLHQTQSLGSQSLFRRGKAGLDIPGQSAICPHALSDMATDTHTQTHTHRHTHHSDTHTSLCNLEIVFQWTCALWCKLCIKAGIGQYRACGRQARTLLRCGLALGFGWWWFGWWWFGHRINCLSRPNNTSYSSTSVAVAVVQTCSFQLYAPVHSLGCWCGF
jgi:hypothetical protein